MSVVRLDIVIWNWTILEDCSDFCNLVFKKDANELESDIVQEQCGRGDDFGCVIDGLDYSTIWGDFTSLV